MGSGNPQGKGQGDPTGAVRRHDAQKQQIKKIGGEPCQGWGKVGGRRALDQGGESYEAPGPIRRFKKAPFSGDRRLAKEYLEMGDIQPQYDAGVLQDLLIPGTEGMDLSLIGSPFARRWMKENLDKQQIRDFRKLTRGRPRTYGDWEGHPQFEQRYGGQQFNPGGEKLATAPIENASANVFKRCK